MRIRWMLLGVLLASGCATVEPPPASGPSPYLLLLAADKDGADDDFFAVVDVRPASPTAGTVLATTPFGHRNSMPHHMEYTLPARGRLLFANAHHPEETMLVDVGNAPDIRVVRTLSPPGALRFPHDYARLPSGNVLIGFLRSGGAHADDAVGGHGGIAEYTADGEFLRSAR